MKMAILKFPELGLRAYELSKFRGYIGNLYKNENLTHNHDENGKPIYRYSLIQYKLINKIPAIIAITQPAIDVVAKIFLNTDSVEIEGFTIPVHEKDFTVNNVEMGYSEQLIMYQFTSPWIAFNSENYRIYRQLQSFEEKNELLKRILIGNILKVSGAFDIRLEKAQRLQTEIKLKTVPVYLKGIKMSGFTGIFKTNYMIPDHFGLGKSSSRGFGTIKKLLQSTDERFIPSYDWDR